jgi:hypothetical protein
MLFDLRSRGRRRTVQAVYLGLAILIGGGLVLFGVGAGNGIGGLLNGLGGGGSSGAQKQVVSQAEQTALQETKLRPSDPQAWADLLRARWTSAGQGNNYDTATGTFTASGKRELAAATGAWARYLQLTKSPDPSLAVLASRAYTAVGNYAGAASAWEAETLASPTEAKGYECLAVTSYAANQARKGDLAAGKALALLPKAQESAAKLTLKQAKSSSQTAQQIAAQC